MKRRIVEFLATGFYLGKLPRAPGTWGTLLGIPLVFAFKQGSPTFYLWGSLILLLFAIAIAEMHEVLTKSHDSGQVVIDEVVGFVIAMTWLPVTLPFVLAGFVFFRVFDILKPFPISYLDQRVRGGLGTVLDDVAAGLITNLILQIIYQKTSWLGETWNGQSLG